MRMAQKQCLIEWRYRLKIILLLNNTPPQKNIKPKKYPKI